MISRTGYTGEDGFEIFVPPNMADRVWQAILESGRAADVIPAASAPATRCGSRPPCGCTATTSTKRRRRSRPAWRGRRLEEGVDFIGHERLREQKEQGITRKLVGFEMIDRGIARHGYQVVRGGHASRRRHERDADAVPEEGHRHGVRAA